MEKQIFKKGDTVYWGQLKGEVVGYYDDRAYQMFVRFENGSGDSFTPDGRLFEELPQVLSFTPYTLKGFSQERLCEFEDGDAVLVKNCGESVLTPRIFKEYKGSLYCCYESSGVSCWEQCKPFKKEEIDNSNH